MWCHRPSETSRPIHTHANLRLPQRGLLRLASQILNDHRPLAELAKQLGINLRWPFKWLARYRSGCVAALADRLSVRRSQRRTLDPNRFQHSVELRHQVLHLGHFAMLLAAPFSTVARTLNRLGLGRGAQPCDAALRRRDTWSPYLHRRDKAGSHPPNRHRITGNRQQGGSTGAGYDLAHVAIDDATRLAYVEVLEDEQQGAALGFLSRTVAWFNGQGVECQQVMSDNGPAQVSRSFAKACAALGLRHIRTSPYASRTNGKAERFIQNLCREWAYSMPFHNSVERNRWLPRYLSIYNRIRSHPVIGDRTPQQRLNKLLA